MERPTNPMTITAVFTFAEPLGHAALAALVRGQLLTHARFRQRVVDGGAGHAYWQDVPALDLDEHLIRVALPEGAGREGLEALVSGLMSECLPRDRPHWQFHLVERYRGGSALVARVHHCIGDGISLVQLLLAMADPCGRGRRAAAPAARRAAPRHREPAARYVPDVAPPRRRAPPPGPAWRARPSASDARDDDGVRALVSPAASSRRPSSAEAWRPCSRACSTSAPTRAPCCAARSAA
jgi:hypothetical protein